MRKSNPKMSRALKMFCVIAVFTVFLLPTAKAENADLKNNITVFNKLKDADPTVRSAEALRLGFEKVKEAVPSLIEALKDEVTGVRINAVVSLGKLGDSAAVEPLIDILNNDKVVAARAMAAEALGNFRDDRAASELLKACDSANDNIRCSAVGAIGNIGNDAAVKKLMNKAENDPDWSVREAAVLAVSIAAEKGDIREKEALKVLKRIIKKEKNKRVQVAAEKALARTGKAPKKKNK